MKNELQFEAGAERRPARIYCCEVGRKLSLQLAASLTPACFIPLSNLDGQSSLTGRNSKTEAVRPSVHPLTALELVYNDRFHHQIHHLFLLFLSSSLCL
jgi:hypothetical protein